MANELLTLSPTEEARPELKSYNVTLPMESLAIGVDNIHHDVFLSPKFVQAGREYLFDVIRQYTSTTYLPGIEFRPTRTRQRRFPQVALRGHAERFDTGQVSQKR